MRKAVVLASVIVSLVLVAGLAFAGSVVKSSGQTVYVPASFFGYDGGMMVTRMVIRNTDPENAITVNSVKYYSHDGIQLYEYLIQPITIGPFYSKSFKTTNDEFLHDMNDGRPFFLVEWEAEKRVIAPRIGAGIATINLSTGEVTSLSSVGGYVIKDK